MPLLPFIYLAFISLGLPDSALGSAWPAMYPNLGAGVSWAGFIFSIISLGTITSSVLSLDVVRRLGTGKTTALSVATSACALFGFSNCTAFWQLCLWAIPYGLGAGAVDAALNSYVAIRYASRHMSWLHCMWGVGASVGPMVMSWRMTGGSWRDGYLTIGLIQMAIMVVMLISLPLWQRDVVTTTDTKREKTTRQSRRELLRVPGVKELLVGFFFYSAVEGACGNWASSYFHLARGIDAQTAAGLAAALFIGVTIGRAISGFLTYRLSDKTLIRLGQTVIGVGAILLLLPLPGRMGLAGLLLMGLGCAPIYPCIIHCAPGYFGEENSLALTGMQMACANAGMLVMPPLLGLIMQFLSPTLYPVYVIAALAIMTVMTETVNRKVEA